MSDFGLARCDEVASHLPARLRVSERRVISRRNRLTGPATQLTPAADIYSLGAILFELLAGRLPFLGDNALGVMKQSAEKPAPKLRTVAPHLDRDLETICCALPRARPLGSLSIRGKPGAGPRELAGRPPHHRAASWTVAPFPALGSPQPQVRCCVGRILSPGRRFGSSGTSARKRIKRPCRKISWLPGPSLVLPFYRSRYRNGGSSGDESICRFVPEWAPSRWSSASDNSRTLLLSLDRDRIGKLLKQGERNRRAHNSHGNRPNQSGPQADLLSIDRSGKQGNPFDAGFGRRRG